MAWAVGHMGDQPGVGARRARAQLVEQRADPVHDLVVGFLVPAADVVGLAETAAGQHRADRAAVVVHKEPVAHLLSVAVDRQRLARQRVDDHQRDQFLWKVIRPVVVAAVGRDHRQAIGVVPGPHQVVAGGFAGRVRAVGLVGMGFGESGCVGLQAAVDLVGADMVEAKARLGIGLQAAPVGPGGLEQRERALDVGLHEGARPADAAVDMALGGKVQTSARAVLGEQAVDQRAVTDVALDEVVARIALQAGQVRQVAGIGHRIEVDDGLVAGLEPVEHEVAADEAGTTGDENGHVVALSRWLRFAQRAQAQPAKPCRLRGWVMTDRTCLRSARCRLRRGSFPTALR